MPSTWALSQLQISYVSGFVKRGLTGQLLYVAHLRSAHAVVVFCLLELSLLIALVAWFTWRSGLLSKRGCPPLVAAFAGSYTVTFVAHLIGYQDVTLYTLTIATVLVRDHRWRFVIALPVCILAPLIHEHFFLSAMPILLFSFFAEDASNVRQATQKYAALLFLLTTIMTIAVTNYGTLSTASFMNFQRQTLSRAQYRVDPHVLAVVEVSTVENLSMHQKVIRLNWWWWAELLVGLLVIGPLLVFLIYSASVRTRRSASIVFAAFSLMPLLLNVVAWDNVRWLCLCALTTYCNFGLLVRSTPAGRSATNAWEQQAAILVMGLGLASGHGLMDGQKINPYPFFPPALRPTVIRHDGVLGKVL